MPMHSRVHLTARFRCEEKKVRVDAFACEFENVDFYYDPQSELLIAEIQVLCPKCGKFHFLRKETFAQEIVR